MAEIKVTELTAITLESFSNDDSFLIIDDGKARRITRAVFKEWMVANVRGERGEQGVAGRDGARGTNGINGTDGTNGIGIYQLAVSEGFSGSVQDYLDSLNGANGEKGEDGGDGWSPVFEVTSVDNGSFLKIVDWVGGTGTKPTTIGFVGDIGIVQDAANASNLKGEKGDDGAQGIQGIQGVKGEQGDVGDKGDIGIGAYELAVSKGFVGTEDEYLLSLNPSEVSGEPNNIITKKIDGMFAPATDPQAMATAIDALPDTNLITDAQKTKLDSLVTSKYLGTFLTLEAIPTEGAEAGNYADVDSGEPDVDTQRWIYDVESAGFVKSVSIPASETNESVKEKYEANADTNVFTDLEKLKLDNLEPIPPVLKVLDSGLVLNSATTDMGATFLKNGVGDYTISNSTGLSTTRLNTVLPRDLNGNYLIAAEVTESEVGVINLKTFVRIFSPETGVFSPDIAQPLDIPTDSWVELWLI